MISPTTDGDLHSLDGHRSAYLVGIGGTGMCGAAQILRGRGLRVRGSDARDGGRVQRLRASGVAVDVGESASALPPDVDLLVHTAAVGSDHPQLVEARRRGLAAWKYAELVGVLMGGRTGISIAGCHGKTTTTALVASALAHAGRDPSFVVGGDLKEFGSGARAGNGRHFVAEACEYDRSFLRHRPRVAVVTNVDADHLDYYRDLAEIEDAFRDFVARLPAGGLLVVHEDHAHRFRCDPRCAARIETYGFGRDAFWRVGEPVLLGGARRSAFTLSRDGWLLGSFHVPLMGRHNALNAAAAAAVLHECGLGLDEIAAGLASFGGVGRRLELVADRGGVLVFDDYGHHPAEIRAVVRALRARYEGRRLVLLFQPHQASRTERLLGDFAQALAEADEAWLPPIYAARESGGAHVDHETLAAEVRAAGGRAETMVDLGAVLEHAVSHSRPGDVLVTMGAGDVDEVAHGLARRLR